MLTWAEQVKAKLEWLSQIDRTRREFGASTHQYRTAPPLDEDELSAIEEINGYRFPPEIRVYWQEVGAGGAGPHYGVCAPDSVQPFRPREPFTPIDELKRLSGIREAFWNLPEVEDRRDDETTWFRRFDLFVEYVASLDIELPAPAPASEDGYFEGAPDDITGLLGVIQVGCGHWTAVGTRNPELDIVFSVGNEGGVWQSQSTFMEHYDRWLDELITAYTDLLTTTTGGTDMESIRPLSGLVRSKAVERLASAHGIQQPQLTRGNEINAWTDAMLDHFDQLPRVQMPPPPSNQHG